MGDTIIEKMYACAQTALIQPVKRRALGERTICHGLQYPQNLVNVPSAFH